MTRRKKWALGAALVLVAAGVIAWLKVPDIIRWYVRGHVAGVDPRGAIQVRWTAHQVVLHQVAVERPGISAVLNSVTVDESRNVTIEGGTLNVVLEDLPKKGTDEPTSGTKIVATGLTVKLRRGKVTADLKGTRVNDEEVCFHEGTIEHPKATAMVEEGCLRRDKSRASAKSVSVPIRLPFDIPKVKPTQTVKLSHVEVEIPDQLVRFDQATLGPFTAGPSTVKLADDVVLVDTQAIKVNHPWIAPHPVSFEAVGLDLPLALLKGGEGKIRVQLGRANIRIDPRNQAVEGEEPCSEWFDALPKPLPETMQGMADNYTGSLQFEVQAKPTPHLEIKHTCKFKCSAPPIKGLVGHRFSYEVYDKDNKLVERTTGPGTKDWVPFSMLPQQVPEAFRLMEDPGFLSHNGISVMALKNSLIANLKNGGFVKGGSTITMQLAKNLWLRRHKTIGRKADEALLTIALESCLSKQQIMELYLNVIEFGPDLYGIGPASKHYFHKLPSELLPDEAFYLASILPKPRKALPPEAGGLARAKRIMTRLANSGFISDALIDDDENLGDTNTADWKVLP